MKQMAQYLSMGLLFLLPGCMHNSFSRCGNEALFAMAAGSAQAVVVSAKPASNPSQVEIRRYEKSEGCWHQVGPPLVGVAGTKGIAPPGEKREGDGRTPSGTFPLERGFGYAPQETRIPYIVVNRQTIWIDDPKSPDYNTLVSRDKGTGYSFEEMRRKDDLYKYGIVVEYNTRHIVPGNGSAIFFHIWRGRGTSTAGCIAAAEENIVAILQWLDPLKNPVTIIRYPDLRK